MYLEDPLLCPECGHGMQILSFITDPPVVDRILRHLKWQLGAAAGLCRSTETVTSVEMVGIQARFLTLSGIDFLIPGTTLIEWNRRLE